MPHILIAAATTAILLLAFWKCHRYPAFLISLAATLPMVWIPVDYGWPKPVWKYYVWLPCALVLIPAQAVAALEACLRFGERYQLAARISGALMIFGAAGAAAFWAWPGGKTAIAQVVLVAKYQQVSCFVFLILSVALYATIGRVSRMGLLTRPDGAHLIWCVGWMSMWMVPNVRPLPDNWPEWLVAHRWWDTVRILWLLVWAGTILLPRFQRIHPPCQPVNPLHD